MLTPTSEFELGMLPRVNIVVTCTKRKRVPPALGLTLRDVQAPDLRTGFATWLDRLTGSRAEGITARRLYAGDHWSIVQTLESVAAASGLDAVVWVCSSGYGLIGLDTKIKPYSATFSSRHPDTICKWNGTDSRLENRISWWQLQGEWSGPDPSLPRSITKIAAADPESPLLVVASQVYLGAIVKDVQRAAQVLRDPDLLCVVSTGTNLVPGLEGNLLPSSAALQKSVGGSLRTLNIRLARIIIGESTTGDLRASRLIPNFRQRVAVELPLPRYERDAMTDDGIRQYIAEALNEGLEINWSSLLRGLRNSGRACGQERFYRLFQTTKTELTANQ